MEELKVRPGEVVLPIDGLSVAKCVSEAAKHYQNSSAIYGTDFALGALAMAKDVLAIIKSANVSLDGKL